VNGLDLEIDPASRTNGATHAESDRRTDSESDRGAAGSDTRTDLGIDSESDPAGETGVTIAEAAALLGIHANTIRRRIRTGRLPAVLAPGPAGQEYHLTAPTVEALRRELARGGRAPQLRPEPIETTLAAPPPSASESDSGPHFRSDLMTDSGIDLESDLESDPTSDLEHGPRPGAPAEPTTGSVAAGDGGSTVPTGVPVAIAALEAAHRAELRRVEELVTVLRDELVVRRQEQAEEREAHRREVAQLHTLLAQSHQLALPRPGPVPEGPSEPAPAEDAAITVHPQDDSPGDLGGSEAGRGWWPRVLAWLRS